MTMLTAQFITIIGTVVGTGLALGVGLAMLIMRSTARVDADRRALQASMDSFRTAMDAFRAEMQSSRHDEGPEPESVDAD